MNAAVALPEANPRDREVQDVVLRLVEEYAFVEAYAVLGWRLREIERSRISQAERLFLAWRAMPEDGRPDFLAYAHHRRRPEIEGPAASPAGDATPEKTPAGTNRRFQP